MIRRSFRIGLWLGLLGGIAVAVAKVYQARHAPLEPLVDRRPRSAPTPAWPRLDEPAPPPAAEPAPPPVAEPAPPPAAEPAATAASKAPKPASKGTNAPKRATAAKKAPAKKAVPTWVDPDGNLCPRSHPVKAKLSSKIFQLPGMLSYDRTNPDRCYRDADAATKDGFRAAKR